MSFVGKEPGKLTILIGESAPKDWLISNRTGGDYKRNVSTVFG